MLHFARKLKRTRRTILCRADENCNFQTGLYYYPASIRQNNIFLHHACHIYNTSYIIHLRYTMTFIKFYLRYLPQQAFDPFNPLNRLLGPCEPFDFDPFAPRWDILFEKKLAKQLKTRSEDCSLLPENTVTKYPNNKFRKLINEKSSNISSKLFGLITRLKPQTTK